jgi:hypothetical protein
MNYSGKSLKYCIIIRSVCFFNCYSGGVESNRVHSALRPLIGLLYPPRVIMMMEKLVEWLAGETEEIGENLPQCGFVHHKPPCCPDREKPATNRLSYGTAFFVCYVKCIILFVRNSPTNHIPDVLSSPGLQDQPAPWTYLRGGWGRKDNNVILTVPLHIKLWLRIHGALPSHSYTLPLRCIQMRAELCLRFTSVLNTVYFD